MLQKLDSGSSLCSQLLQKLDSGCSCLVPQILQNFNSGRSCLPQLIQKTVVDLTTCLFLDVNAVQIVTKIKMPMTMAASASNKPSVSPSASDIGTKLVELSVVELVTVLL